jgi:hypothetical protein
MEHFSSDKNPSMWDVALSDGDDASVLFFASLSLSLPGWYDDNRMCHKHFRYQLSGRPLLPSSWNTPPICFQCNISFTIYIIITTYLSHTCFVPLFLLFAVVTYHTHTHTHTQSRKGYITSLSLPVLVRYNIFDIYIHHGLGGDDFQSGDYCCCYF